MDTDRSATEQNGSVRTSIESDLAIMRVARNRGGSIPRDRRSNTVEAMFRVYCAAKNIVRFGISVPGI